MSAHRLPARQCAIVTGNNKYIGKVCPRGHDGVRYTANAKCVRCVAIYYDAYRKLVRR